MSSKHFRNIVAFFLIFSDQNIWSVIVWYMLHGMCMKSNGRKIKTNTHSAVASIEEQITTRLR